MEQAYEDLTQSLKCENEIDIEGTVIKIELKPPLPQIKMLLNVGLENAKQDEHNVEIKSENQAQNEPRQNSLSIEETIDSKLENEEIRSYICGKSLNSKENPSTMIESSTTKTKVKEQNICEICNKSFSRKYSLKLHVNTVHDEVKEHKCETCSKTFGQNCC